MKASPALDKFPMLEIVYRAGDSRPVIVQLYSGEGGQYDARVSPGNAEDMAECEAAVRAASMVIQSCHAVRFMLEELNNGTLKTEEPADAPPF